MTDPATEQAVVEAIDLHRSYRSGDGSTLEVLRGVDLEVRAGESVAIIGASGSGKSTLLHLLGGLDRPTSGQVVVKGHRLAEASDVRLSELRNAYIGFVFQFHHLLREFSALENVMMPQLIAGRSHAEAARRAGDLLDQVGLASRVDHRPGQLSGGEQQRVAVARALANQPVAILADEPSGNLDPNTSERLHDVLFGVCAEHNTAIVVVTHNMRIATRSDRVLEMQDGRLVAASTEAYESPGRQL